MLRIFYKLESLHWYLFLFRKSAFLNQTNCVSNHGNISVVFYAKTRKIKPKEKAKLWCHREKGNAGSLVSRKRGVHLKILSLICKRMQNWTQKPKDMCIGV